MKNLIRRILREETNKMPLRHMLLSKSVNEPLDVSGESGDTISGKEINSVLPDGVLYHASHNPNLNKNNVRLFSRGGDLGNSEIGDRYGFYVTPDIKESAQYLWGWVKSDNLIKQGKDIVNKMKPNIKEELFNILTDIHISYGNKSKESFDDLIDDLDFAMIAGVYNGLWPSLYRVSIVDNSRFVPMTDLDITHDEYAKITQLNKVKGIGGIYAGELGGRYGSYAKHNEMAILNRNVIQSMDKVGDEEFWSMMSKLKGPMGDEHYMIKHKKYFFFLKRLFGK